MALSTIMGTSYACLGAVRNLENVGKKTCADLLLNFRERRKAEVQLRRKPLLGTSVNKPPADVPGSARWHHAWCRPSRATRDAKEEEILCRPKKRTRPWCAASWRRRLRVI